MDEAQVGRADPIGMIDLSSRDRNRLFDLATRLGDEIWKQRVAAKGGALTWYRPPSDSRGEAGAPIRIDPFLYDGVTGIAFFFAALETFHRDGQNRQRCLAALQAVRSLLAGLTSDPERSRNLAVGLGGVIGLGSIVYVLSQVAHLLNEEKLLEEAGQLLPLFSRDRIERDAHYDLLYGAAGAILALLAFERVAGSAAGPLALELAGRCADHLVRNRAVDEQTGLRAWTTLAGVALLGNLNHGASGICYALLQLYRRTGDAVLAAAAREGLAYESQHFVPGRGNWRDLRFPSQDHFERSWCSGSPGMAVVRLTNHDLLDGSRLHEAEIAIEALCQAALLRVDHLCCGNCGIVEALLLAAIAENNSILANEARRRLLAMIKRATARDVFAFRRPPNHLAFDPSFFTGAAGLGYTCLRLVKPFSLPSVLLLQPVQEGSIHALAPSSTSVVSCANLPR